MRLFLRSDKSLLARWWWSVDRPLLISFTFLMLIGVMLTMAGSPSVAERIGLDAFYFVRRHGLMLLPTLVFMIFLSFGSLQTIRVFSFALGTMLMILLGLTLLIGMEAKGARRWLSIGGFSLQASEFMKPAFCIINAWIFSKLPQKYPDSSPILISLLFYITLVGLLLLQPDLGMTVLFSIIWGAQFFMTGISMRIIGILIGTAMCALGIVYMSLSHVSDRIHKFFFSSADKFGGGYQIEKSLSAFKNGGFWGQGPGEGVYKKYLPDAHADFIFSVAGEEFGVVICLIIVGVFCFIFTRSMILVSRSRNYFNILSVVGLGISLTVQALINMASVLNLIPTKGMTLPFISYGGSSLWALGIHTGLLLAIIRQVKKNESNNE